VPRHEVAVVLSSATVGGIASMDLVTQARGGYIALTFQKSNRLSPDLALTRYESASFTRPAVCRWGSQVVKGCLQKLWPLVWLRLVIGILVVAACVVEAGHRYSCQRQMLHKQNHRFSIIIEFFHFS